MANNDETPTSQNRLLLLLAASAAATALIGAGLALLLPLCDTDGGRSVSCLVESGPETILRTTPPTLASVAAVLLVRWRLVRLVAAGMLWFWTIFFVGAFAFYVLSAVLQTASVLVPYRQTGDGEAVSRRDRLRSHRI